MKIVFVVTVGDDAHMDRTPDTRRHVALAAFRFASWLGNRITTVVSGEDYPSQRIASLMTVEGKAAEVSKLLTGQRLSDPSEGFVDQLREMIARLSAGSVIVAHAKIMPLLGYGEAKTESLYALRVEDGVIKGYFHVEDARACDKICAALEEAGESAAQCR